VGQRTPGVVIAATIEWWRFSFERFERLIEIDLDAGVLIEDRALLRCQEPRTPMLPNASTSVTKR
jgi:hypothetical protein